MDIAGINLPNKVILAPMAGVTDIVTRRIAKEFGVGLTVSEMVNDMGLIYAQQQTFALANLDEPGLRSAQIFGSKPENMHKAAAIVARFAPDFIDINMGCPARKIVSGGGGSALMLDQDRAVSIVKAVISAVSVPVTAKIRSGWDPSCINAPEFATALQAAGASAITVHARTRDQFYSGNADLDIIKKVKAAVSIPVIGNGDIQSAEDAKHMLEYTGCDAIMIGRAAMGNPWLLQRIVHFLEDGTVLPHPTAQEKIDLAIKHLEQAVVSKGEYTAVREMRKHCAWYIKGLPGAAQTRVLLNSAESAEEMRTLLKKPFFFCSIPEQGSSPA